MCHVMVDGLDFSVLTSNTGAGKSTRVVDVEGIGEAALHMCRGTHVVVDGWDCNTGAGESTRVIDMGGVLRQLCICVMGLM